MSGFPSPARRRTLIAVVGAALVAAAVAGGFWVGRGRDTRVVSDDGAATLAVPRGALPEGTRVADLTVTKLTGADIPRAEGGSAVLSAYRLEPDGLTLSSPVTLTVVLPPQSAPGVSPVVRVLSEDGGLVEPVTSEVAKDATGAVTVSASLSHFSLVLYSVGLIAIEHPNDLGTHAVGEAVAFPVTVARLARAPFTQKPLIEIMEGKPKFETSGRFVSHTPGVVQATDTRSQPPEGTVMEDAFLRVEGQFRCVGPGRGRVAYEGIIYYAHRFEPPGSLPPWVKAFGETVRLWPEATVHCTASSSPSPETSPTPTPAEVSTTEEEDETPATPTPVVLEPPARPATPTPAAVVSRGSNRPPTVEPITAALNPPTTTYTVRASDPDGNALTYRWSSTGSCGSFAGGGGASTSWSHPSGDPPSGCPHEEGTSHPGTISVRVSDGTATVTCTYDGSESGTGPACTSAP